MTRWTRRITLTAIGLVLLAGATVQAVLWSDLPRRWAVAALEHELDATVRIASLTTHWSGRTTILGLRLTAPLGDEPVLDVPVVQVRHNPVISAVFTGLQARRVELRQPTIRLTQDAIGRWNLPAPVDSRDGPTHHWPVIHATDLTLHIDRDGHAPVSVSPVTLAVSPIDSRTLRVSATSPGIGQAELRLAITGDYAHRLTVDLATWPGLENNDRHTRIAGAWQGRFHDATLSGRVTLDEARLDPWLLRGQADVTAREGTMILRPAALNMTTAHGPVTIAGGEVEFTSDSVTVRSLEVVTPDAGAELDGRYQRLHGRHILRLVFDARGRIGATPWSLAGNIGVTGDDFHSLVGNIDLERVRYDRFEHQTLTGRVTLNWPTLTLDALTIPQAPDLDIHADVNLLLARWTAELATGGPLPWRDFPAVSSLSVRASGVGLRADIEEARARVGQVLARFTGSYEPGREDAVLGQLEVSGQSHDPVSLRWSAQMEVAGAPGRPRWTAAGMATLHTPTWRGQELAPLIEAPLSCEVHLDEPLQLTFHAGLHGCDITPPLLGKTVGVSGEVAGVYEAGVGVRATVRLGAVLGDAPDDHADLEATYDGRTVGVRSLRVGWRGGTVEGQGAWRLDEPALSSGSLRWREVDLSLAPGLAGTGVTSGELSAKVSDDPRALEPIHVRISAAGRDVTVRGVPVERVEAVAFAGPTRVVVDEFQVDTMGGQVEGWASLSRREAGVFAHVQGRLVGLDVGRVIRVADPASPVIHGRLDGRFTTFGPVNDLDRIYGGLNVELTEADLERSRILGLLYDTMRLNIGSAERRGHGHAAFRLEGRRLRIVNLVYFNRGAEVRASGAMDDLWQGADSPLTGYVFGWARPLKGLKLPGADKLDELLTVLQANVTTVRVRGTLGNPQPVIVSIEDVGDALSEVLFGVER